MARQADPETDPGPLATWMAPFAGCFTRPTWSNLLCGIDPVRILLAKSG